MPRSPQFDENDVIRACEAAHAVEKPNLSALSRQFKVPYGVLRGRIRQGAGPRKGRKASNIALNPYQEKALVYWIDRMQRNSMPITPVVLQDWANNVLTHAGSERKIELKLQSVIQKSKEANRMEAEQAAALSI
ncbi:hypothetical protein N7450_010329 [Penicillium hetheringtonii]|uniref:HTH CENPB-type domain-containing protein n=1 Tax=Penicillium hetheringtonii TaxID=911720 RepID=A0AAD6DEN4_9EURO|nr:hypothetical protein N7450_010329 [Penicillium hetheringtonii]